MNTAKEQLLDAALALPDEDRLEIVEALAASLQPADRPPFDESWREVILRRSAELLSGKVAPVPWSEVRKRARQALAYVDSNREPLETEAEIGRLMLKVGD
jgi:putative addiction module component (TIGR02574 family)